MKIVCAAVFMPPLAWLVHQVPFVAVFTAMIVCTVAAVTAVAASPKDVQVTNPPLPEPVPIPALTAGPAPLALDATRDVVAVQPAADGRTIVIPGEVIQ